MAKKNALMDTLTYSALNCVLGSKDKDVKIESLPLSVKRINDNHMKSFLSLMIVNCLTAHFKMIGLHFTSEERKMRNARFPLSANCKHCSELMWGLRFTHVLSYLQMVAYRRLGRIRKMETLLLFPVFGSSKKAATITLCSCWEIMLTRTYSTINLRIMVSRWK